MAVDRLAVEQPAQQRSPSASTSGRPSRWPAAISASAAPRWRTTAAPRATASAGPATTARSSSTASASRSRARGWRGSTASTSAAPSAANAIARRCGERCPAPWSKYDIALRAHPLVRRAGGRRCRTPTRCAPSSPRRRAGRASGRRRRAGCGCVRSTPCDIGEERNAVRPSSSQRLAGVRLADDRDQQPGHVVGAVAVFAPGCGVVGVLEDADRRRSSPAHDAERTAGLS